MLHVQLFGAFSIERERSRRIAVDPAVRPLASFLFSFPNQLHRKEKVLDLFWPNAPEKLARASMYRASWRIRQRLSLCARSGIRLLANQNELWLELPDANVVDAHRFRGAVIGALSPGPAGIDLFTLERAVNCYKGLFLDEYDEDWVLDQRERLQALYLRSLTILMSSYAQGRRIVAAIASGRRILACDPMRETIQRTVMILYVLNSQRGEAILQFDRCRKALREECDVDPAPETCALLRLIRSGEVYGKLPGLLELELAFGAEADPTHLSW